ncbi:MAG: hypothetical protein P9L92_03740 [Candidatus Electryonea clarkiae]|nr:hypothetical protein [Candidatus Electryonea clarkiae]MDP8288746.1 hypothetical protein [Candidatus Electryonea clarkiae]
MEFFGLLFGTLFISALISYLVIFFFKKPVNMIMLRIIGEEIAYSWQKFLTFALFVVGVSSGVNIRKLERFIAPITENNPRPDLTPAFWGLEIYRTIISTLGGLAWALLIFFIVALISYVIVKGRERKIPID